MPRLATATGYHVNLTVTDLERSVDWWCRVFGLVVVGDEASVEPASEEPLRYRSLGSPQTWSYVVGLIQHQAGSQDAADELRAGLDHYALHVPELADLDEWAAHLDALEVPHSGIKRTDYAPASRCATPTTSSLSSTGPNSTSGQDDSRRLFHLAS
jgi:glyoxylase I family protein